jgi:hypothetical protein
VNCAVPILEPQGNQEGSHVEKSCRRIVGDAGEGRRQTLLWNRRRRSESCGGRTAPKWLTNTFLLPHIGSATIEARTAMGMLALDNLEAVLNGRPASTPVPSRSREIV